MKLDYLIKEIRRQVLTISSADIGQSNSLNIDVKGLSLNSKEVKKGYLFFCLSGSRYNGKDFINEASQNGAVAVVIDENIKERVNKKITVIRVKDIIGCLGSVANKFYNNHSDNLNMTAVTGTNGKTTITFILENILSNHNKSVGVIGTINYRFNNNVFTAKNTTPDILTIHNFINKMLENNIKYLLMEVSSHALAQRRIEGLKFNQAIFTNLSQDHFDYHKTKKRYFMAKSLLFRNYLKEGGVAIINIDDLYGRRLINSIKKNKKNRILTYGIKRNTDIWII